MRRGLKNGLLATVASLSILGSGSLGAACIDQFADTLRVTSAFGWRAIPQYQNRWKFHYGVDFSKNSLSKKEVIAGIDGKINIYEGTAGCGTMLIITPDDQSSFKAIKHCHLKRINPELVNGGRVTRDMRLGEPSNIGLSGAAEHIHIEVISDGNAASSSGSKRIPLTQGMLCGGSISGDPVGELTRPSADVAAPGEAYFDAQFYEANYAGGQQVSRSAQAAGSESISGVPADKRIDGGSPAFQQARDNAAMAMDAAAPLDPLEGTFMSVMSGLVNSRFNNGDWMERLFGMGQIPLLFEFLQLSLSNAYLDFRRVETMQDTMALMAERNILLNDLSRNINQDEYARARALATRRID